MKIRDIFKVVEEVAENNIDSRDDTLMYRYLGEIDDPTELFQLFATVDDITSCDGKCNWFICSDGTFYSCGDAEVNALFERNKVVEHKFPFEIERDEMYNNLDRDERISYRMEVQRISRTNATEIVCDELGISAYNYKFTFKVYTGLYNDLDETESEVVKKVDVLANSESEAFEKLYEMGYIHDYGYIVESGTKYTEEDNRNAKETGKFIFSSSYGKHYNIRVQDTKVILIGAVHM